MRAYDEIPLRLQAREAQQALYALRRLDEGATPPGVRKRAAHKLEAALDAAGFRSPQEGSDG